MGSLPRTLREASDALQEGRYTAAELAQETMNSIERSSLGAFITVTRQRAIQMATEADKRLRKGSRLTPIDGVPTALKDIFYIKGVRCTAGSKILSNFVPSYDSAATERLDKAGSVIVGTTNMHEFASGVTSINPHYGPVRNPHDRSRVAGGSSGGSAAAVAGGLVPTAIGTDTSGSVRIPASLCGVYGLKPTFGRISRYGVFPLSTTLDHVGIFSNTPWDLAVLLNLLSGVDARDPASSPSSARQVEDYALVLGEPPDAELVVTDDYFLEICSKEVADAFRKVLRRFEKLGFRVREVRMPWMSEAREIWAPIRLAEAAAVHSRWMEDSAGEYGEDVLAMLKRGAQFSGVEYLTAVERKASFTRRLFKTLSDRTVLATPTCPITAPLIRSRKIHLDSRELDIYTILSRNTIHFNVTGFPALSFPAGYAANGLPVGVQLVTRPWRERLLLSVAYAYEEKYLTDLAAK